ncbi:MAG: hypothetical protein ACK4SL_03425 [Candidatus Paceibacteria bacterium]
MICLEDTEVTSILTKTSEGCEKHLALEVERQPAVDCMEHPIETLPEEEQVIPMTASVRPNNLYQIHLNMERVDA